MLADAARSRSRHVYAIRCASHYHMHRLVRVLAERDHPLINVF